MDRIGQVLDKKYKLSRLLGEGGMGAVYEARHVVIGRRCAVKFLHAEIAHNEEVVKRFIREAQAASAIGHPNIIDIYDFGVADDGAPYLVMEFLEGVSLADELEQRRKLPPAEAAEVLAQVLGALAVAHERGVVHRDLKPDNLYLIRQTGSAPRVKILDFGISKVSNPSKPEDRMTCTGMVLGTPYYMAPEQARGDRDIDHRLDLYAMGIIFYEAVTGRVPFTGDNYNQLLLKILTEKFPTPRQLDPTIPEGFEAIILKAVERDRAMRYQTAGEMLDDILQLLDDNARSRLGIAGPQPLVPELRAARTPTAQTLTPLGHAMDGTMLVRRNRWALPAAIVGALAVAAVGLALWAPWKSTEGTASPSPELAVAGSQSDAGPDTPATRLVAVAAGPLDAALPEATAPVPAADIIAAPAADAGSQVAAADAAPAEVAAPAAEAVTIALQNLPQGAQVFWDGAKLDSVPFRVRKDTVAVRLEVQAAGYGTFSSMVTPDRDVTLSPDMRRTGRTTGTRPTQDAGAPTVVVTQVPTPPTQPRTRDAGLQQGGRGTSIATGFE
jgi:tRNA A-37 threonylcarbamoyl transferase component Bud32